MWYFWDVISVGFGVENTLENPPQIAIDTQIWVECHPISGFFELWSQLPANIQSRGSFANITSAEFAKLGGQLDGSIKAFGDEHLMMELDFQGQPDQVPKLLKVLYPQSQIWKTQNGWSMELPDDRLLITLKEGRLQMHSVMSDTTQFGPLEMLGSNLTDLNGQPLNGCRIQIQNGPLLPVFKQPINGGMILPFDNEPIQVTLASNETSLLQGKGATPMAIYTKQHPMVLATIGLSSAELFQEPRFKAESGMSEKQLKKLQKRLRIRPGAFIALSSFQIQNRPDVWVGMEVENRFGGLQCEWLLWRGVKKALKDEGLDVLILDEKVLSFQYKGSVWYLGVQKGRILLSSTREMLNDMKTPDGTLWSDDDLTDMAQNNALAVQVNIPKMMSLMMGGLQALNVGITGTDSELIVSIDPQFFGQNSLVQLITMLSGFSKTSVASVPEFQLGLMNLAAQEHQYFAKEGGYLYVNPSGKNGSENWSKMARSKTLSTASTAQDLGWLSTEEDIMYWVEISEAGFVAHAYFWDPDSQQMMHATEDHKGYLSVLPE